jgi:transcriptional regulator with XRE-family HTH domain
MIERGERQYDQEFLEAAAEALGTTPDRLLRINPQDPRSEDTIFETVRRIPLEDRPKALAILEAFSRKPAANDETPALPSRPVKRRARKRPAA